MNHRLVGATLLAISIWFISSELVQGQVVIDCPKGCHEIPVDDSWRPGAPGYGVPVYTYSAVQAYPMYAPTVGGNQKMIENSTITRWDCDAEMICPESGQLLRMKGWANLRNAQNGIIQYKCETTE